MGKSMTNQTVAKTFITTQRHTLLTFVLLFKRVNVFAVSLTMSLSNKNQKQECLYVYDECISHGDSRYSYEIEYF